MIVYKTNKEIELVRESSLLVGKALAEVAKVLKPGVNTSKLDQVAEEFIRDHGAVPGPEPGPGSVIRRQEYRCLHHR